MKKIISNELYNIAYNNLDNQRIIKSVLAKYRKQLDDDTLRTCGMHAIWRCLESHDETYSTKFTSSLWRFVNWECKKELQVLARSKFKPQELTDIAINVDAYNIFDDLSNILNEEEVKLIKLRFVEGMTLKEIGKEFGYTKEAARLKLKYTLDQIRSMVYNSTEGKDNNRMFGLNNATF